MTDKYLRLDAEFVKAEVAKLLAAYPELAEDETLRMDTVEAETNAYTVIERALAERLEAEMMCTALAQRKHDIVNRLSRFERKSDAMKDLIKAVMKVAQLDRLTLAEATLTITQPRQSVGIEDIDQLPQGYVKLTKTADKDAIRKAFANGESVPGAIMVLGQDSLTIRTK